MATDDGPIPDRRSQTETLDTAPLPEGPEQRIGAYRVIRELGRGGMGTVYLAARADEEYQKRVAIKVIRAGLASEEVVRHFRRERQILAIIEHPNIARLLEGGATEDGSPYFVMEYIQGQSLFEYCDRLSLDTLERLKLFQGVCSAVQHAHRNLIVHRDIKPANILVTSEGVPKLLDFGIAKFLNLELSGSPDTATAMVMTPEYASPEQARGEPITTASDVYSLGIVLYELLSGRSPYRVQSRNPLDILRAVIEEEPERPSTVVDRTEPASGTDPKARDAASASSLSRTREGTPDRLRRRLRGDLDNIVMMALRKEPQRRYASVEALSEDLRRYLEGRPVLARRGGIGYRLGKFVRRNRLAVASSVVILGLVVASTVATAVQNRRIAREREKAERVAAFLVDLFKVSDPDKARGSTITAREVLDQGADRITKGLDDQPDVRATLMETMGDVYRNLGLFDRATGLLQDAIGLRRQGLGANERALADDLNKLGLVQDERGDYAGAESSYREALAIQKRVLGKTAEVAHTLNNLGNTARHKGDYASAESYFTQSLELKRQLFGNVHEEISSGVTNLAIVFAVKGELARAEPLFRQGLEIDRQLLGPDSPRVANDLNNLGAVLGDQGEWAKSEAIHRETLALRRKLYGPEHPNVAESLNNVGFALLSAGQSAEAEPFLRDAIAMRKKFLGADHPLVARSMSNLAHVRRALGDDSAAEALLTEALAIQRRRLGNEHPLVAEAESSLAQVVKERGDLAQAERLLREALGIVQKATGEASTHTASVTVSLGGVLARTGRAAEAEPMVRRALEILQKAFPPDHPDPAEAEGILGECLLLEGRLSEAEPLLVSSHDKLTFANGAASREAKEAAARLARLKRARSRSPKA